MMTMRVIFCSSDFHSDGSIQGETYLVTYYNQDEFLAHVKRVSVKYFTKPRDFTNVDVIGTTMRDDSHVFAFGNVQVVELNFACR